MSRSSVLKLCISGLSVLCTLGLLELGVRLQCTRTVDGAVRFRSTWLKPYRLPVARVERDMATLQTSSASLLLYDPELGWRPRPGAPGINAKGFRTTAALPPRVPAAGTLRIALFGDSFTEGPVGGGWWRTLEARLNDRGVKSEVLNFGVGGYGMDQAYLRWRKDGAGWRPHLVIFGFFSDDCYRNLNLLRLLYVPDSGISLMKPRFVPEGEGIRLVNSPTPSPGELPGIVREFPAWPLAVHEHFFVADDFRPKPWRWSRLGAYLEARLALAGRKARAEEFFRPGGEAGQVTLRLLRQMHQEVTASGAAFYLAHLPGETDLIDLRGSGRLPHSALLARLREEHEVIDVAPALLAAAGGRQFREYFIGGHYGDEFHRLSGEVISGSVARRHPRATGR